MGARRYALGLAFGVLLGVAVVALSGGPGTPPFGWNPLVQSNAAATTTESVTITSQTTASWETASQLTSQGGNGSNPATATTTSTTTAAATGLPIQGGLSALLSNLPSSQIASVGTQSPAANSLLVIPIIIAFVAGAVIYRTTAGRRDGVREEG